MFWTLLPLHTCFANKYSCTLIVHQLYSRYVTFAPARHFSATAAAQEIFALQTDSAVLIHIIFLHSFSSKLLLFLDASRCVSAVFCNSYALSAEGILESPFGLAYLNCESSTAHKGLGCGLENHPGLFHHPNEVIIVVIIVLCWHIWLEAVCKCLFPATLVVQWANVFIWIHAVFWQKQSTPYVFMTDVKAFFYGGQFHLLLLSENELKNSAEYNLFFSLSAQNAWQD